MKMIQISLPYGNTYEIERLDVNIHSALRLRYLRVFYCAPPCIINLIIDWSKYYYIFTLVFRSVQNFIYIYFDRRKSITYPSVLLLFLKEK